MLFIWRIQISEVKIISATFPLYDLPYTKTPEELISARYTDLNMIQATVEIKTNYTNASEIIRNAKGFTFHIIPCDNTEYEYHVLPDPKEITDESIAKDEEYFTLQMDMWKDSLKAYKKALDLGVNPDFAKYILPSNMLACTFDMCGTIPQWKQWIKTSETLPGDQDNLIYDMVIKALNKYFPSHI